MMPDVARTVAQATDRLVDELTALEGAPIDLFRRLQLLALDIAAKALFSLDLGAEGPPLRAELQAIQRGGRPADPARFSAAPLPPEPVLVRPPAVPPALDGACRPCS